MITQGSKVSLHYKLTVDGEVVDMSAKDTPLTFVQGSGQIIPGLDEQLIGLKTGDKKNVTVAPEKGYGPHLAEAVQPFPKKAFQNADELKEGHIVSGQVQDQPFQATVVKISDDEVVLDMNHPLAGKDLEFEIEIVMVEKA